MDNRLHLIEMLELITELQAQVIKVLIERLAELGDTETGKDEIAEADRLFMDVVGEKF